MQKGICLGIAGLLLAAVLALPAGAVAGTANRGLPGAPASNPLAGMTWGIYTGAYDGVYSTYAGSRGRQRALLSKIALRPAAHWFGAWYADSDAGGAARRYISNVTQGDPSVLTQIAVFRLDPWEQAACTAQPSAARVASFRHWIDNFAAGIGDSRTALILQPDLPFALCSPARSQWLGMVNYATRKLSGQPYTTVYIDAGAKYWTSPAAAAQMLAAAGARWARGIALNDTEYDSLQNELGYGQAIISALGARGIGGKHMVINTAENGAPFLNGQYHGDITNPRVCRSRHDTICVTLGIPPTWKVADPRWGLGAAADAIAARYADAYLWVGRPWLFQGAGAFDLQRALALVTSSPF